MKVTPLILLALAPCAGLPLQATAAAIPLSNQYNVAFNPIKQADGSYQFDFQVTNVTQNMGAQTGLDGFLAAVPHAAVVSGVVNPPSYSSGGNWSMTRLPTSDPTEDWIEFWGNGPSSVYPIGTTAGFSFVTDSIIPIGLPIATLTYWGILQPSVDYSILLVNNVNTYYNTFTGFLPAPVGDVPEPASIGLLALGTLGLLVRRARHA